MAEQSMIGTLQLWNEAVSLAERGNFQDALMKFMALEERTDSGQAMITSARNMFNIGQTFLGLGKLDKAVEAFKESLEKDKMLGVAYFMLGCTHLRQSRDAQALKNFDNAYFFLRGNRLIDYKQLGLKYKLCGSEILCNRAICHARLGNDQQARNDFLKAIESKVDPKHAVIEEALLCWQTGTYMQPIELPSHAVFQPPHGKVKAAQEKKQNYLGKSEVVASDLSKVLTTNGQPTIIDRGELLNDLRKKETRQSLKKRQQGPSRGPRSVPPIRSLPDLPRRESPSSLQANVPPPRPTSPHPRRKGPDSPGPARAAIGKPPSKPLPPTPRGKIPNSGTRTPPLRPASPSLPPPQLPARREEGTVTFQLVITRTVQVNKNSSVVELSRAAAKALDMPEDAFTLCYTGNNNELTHLTDEELGTLWKTAPENKPTVLCYEAKR